jgi:hypothetical protein
MSREDVELDALVSSRYSPWAMRLRGVIRVAKLATCLAVAASSGIGLFGVLPATAGERDCFGEQATITGTSGAISS